MSPDLDELKRRAARRAADAVRSGFVVGLGTGSTADHVTRRIGEMLREGGLRDVRGVPTSGRTARLAARAGIPLATLEEQPVLDVAIDGADEVDPALDLIKGLGGALLREKIVAVAARETIIVVDASKRVDRLGRRSPVPVEVDAFGWSTTRRFLESLGARVVARAGDDGAPFLTDGGNRILDCHFGPIDDPAALAGEIRSRAGVLEHGLFLGIATRVIVASEGGVEELRR